jgi:hypothetical protein
MRLVFRLPLAAAAFRPASGQCRKTLSMAFALYRSRYLGAVFRSPVTTFSRHCGVNVPALHLRFPAEHLRGSVRSWTPSLPSVSRPIGGVILAQYPLTAPVSGALVSSACLRSPLGTFAPSGSKRSASIQHVKLVLQNSDLRSLPGAISLDFAPDQRSRSAASRLTNRSVNPGTDAIMRLFPKPRQTKNSMFHLVLTTFLNLTFQ